MKKLITLLLAAGMIFTASASASAVDVKMDGEYLFNFILGERVATGDNFDNAGQRLRLGMAFTASESLSGYFQVQVGTAADSTTVYDWGSDTSGNSTKIGMRQAYVDWVIPQTAVKVRMGRQLVGLPEDAFGKNAIMYPAWQGRDGIVVTSPVTDWLDLTAFWLRGAYSSVNSDGGTSADTVKSEKSDFFSLAAAFKFDGFSFTPYVMYAALDKGANVSATTDGNSFGLMKGPDWEEMTLSADGNAFWIGSNFVMSYFDPFVLKLSGAYGGINYEGKGQFSYTEEATGDLVSAEFGNMNNREGWYVQGKASYKTTCGTPIVGAWFGSGDDNDAQYARQGWIPTFNGRFHPTFGYTAGEFALYDTTTRHNIAGTWGVQLGIEDVSFLEDLSHKFTVTYFQGTNDNKLASAMSPWEYMTEDDSVVEFNLSSVYKIYRNLTACLELAYMITDYDKGDHENWATGRDIDKDGWSTALSFAYKF